MTPVDDGSIVDLQFHCSDGEVEKYLFRINGTCKLLFPFDLETTLELFWGNLFTNLFAGHLMNISNIIILFLFFKSLVHRRRD